jgi:hypothetical protein
MQSEYKYFKPGVSVTNSVKPERAKLYDLILVDIIDNAMTHRDACRKHNYDHRGFARVVRVQRNRGLVIPNDGIKAARFDPNGPFKYWVVSNGVDTYENPNRKTAEFGKMWDRIIDELIAGTPTKTITENYGFSKGTITATLNNLRAAGSPIPWLMPRNNIENRGITANPEIFYKPGAQQKVKPSIVAEWADKKEQGYTFAWIAGEYGVSATTVGQHVKAYRKDCA